MLIVWTLLNLKCFLFITNGYILKMTSQPSDTHYQMYPFLILCGARFRWEWPSFQLYCFFSYGDSFCWHVLWWQGIHVSDCAAGSQSLSPSQTWPLSLRLRLPAWPMCFHDPPGTSYLPWSLPSKSLILLTMASRSWMSWHFHLWGTHLFCGYFAFAFSNFNHVWFLSFLISMEGEVVLSLPFTRWSCDFKESPHIKIPFLCNIILIEMLILWKENDG